MATETTAAEVASQCVNEHGGAIGMPQLATDPRFAGPTRETFQDADAERWIAEGIAAHASAKPA